MNRILELIKLSPVMLLAFFMYSGMDALKAAPLATIYAVLVAKIVERHKMSEIIDSIIENAKEMQIAFFILMAAYAMAGVFMSTGVGASIITVALKAGVTGRTVAVVGVLVTSVVSMATGSSWGTFAACAPIFLWLNNIVGGNLSLTLGAIAGGACFGDNIGLISDTTIVSSSLQKVEVIKRVRHQGYWSALVLILGTVAFAIMGYVLDLPTTSGDPAVAISQIPANVWKVLAEKKETAVTLLKQVQNGVPVYMCIPLILVLIAAFRGVTTLVCLFIGIFSAYILGIFAGTVTNTADILEIITNEFKEAGSWLIIMMMWVAAFGGVMKLMDAFRPLSKLIIKISKNVRQLMFWNGTLSILGNAGLADEMAQIVTIGPIIRDIVEKNVDGDERDIEILRLRNATFGDALGVFGSQLIPWHVYIVFYLGVVNGVYPLQKIFAIDIIKYNFLAIIAVVSILFLTLTGVDRFIPRFALPEEPDVRLKKDEIIVSEEMIEV